MPEADDKVLENKLRRMLQRRGYQLLKSRRRDPRAIDYGGYMIREVWNNSLVAGAIPNAYGMSLDEVQRWAEGP